MRRRRGVRLAVAAASLAAMLPALSGPSPVGAETVAPLQTPVLSLRRLPELLAQSIGTVKLASALDAAFSDPKLSGAAATSCLIVRYGPNTLYARNPTMPLVPASNLKLFTATAALDLLGANNRMVTTVLGDSAPAKGIIRGNLYLVGGGDPLLRTPDYVAGLRVREQLYDDLNILADQVRTAGVTTVTGSIVGDESRYDTQRVVPSWPSRYATDGEIGPLSALSVNDGFAVPPPPTVPPPTTTIPSTTPPAPPPPTTTTTTVPKPVAVPSPQPARQAAGIFASLLEKRGIDIQGQPVAGKAPASAAKITELASAPLPDVLGELLRRSDNTGAELITKELGRQSSAQTASTAAGVAAIRADLTAAGLPVDQLHMVDGSGLDRSNRATCQLIIDVLLRSGPSGTLAQGLAVAAKTGTLQSRLVATPAAGRLRAKTGTLEGVSALSGFVVHPAGATPDADLTFSFIENGVPAGIGDALGDQVGVLLANFPQAPPVRVLMPLGTP